MARLSFLLGMDRGRGCLGSPRRGDPGFGRWEGSRPRQRDGLGPSLDGCPCGALAWESVPDGLAMMAVLMGFPLNAAGFLATAETAAGPLV